MKTRPGLSLEVAEHLLAYGRSFETNQVSHVVGAAAEEVAELAGREVHENPEQALALTRLLAHSLSEMVALERPPGAIGAVLKPVIKLALHCLTDEHGDLSVVLLEALAGAPRELVERALRRLERTRGDVYYEVAERVVAFDWVEDDLRELIPLLRAKLDALPSPGSVRPSLAASP
jgi:hypothetical protein